MPLAKKFNRAVLLGLLAITALTGCARKIGSPDSEPELKGTVIEETLARSGAHIKRVHLDGKNLQPGKSYKFNDVSLTIDGDIPEGVSIRGDGGQLMVTGNVGDDADLEVEVPYYSHQEKYTYPGFIMVGKVMVPTTMTGYKTIVDSLQPPYNKDPTIVVKGKTGKDVSFSGTSGTFRDVKP